jgi:hypothetical protein
MLVKTKGGEGGVWYMVGGRWGGKRRCQASEVRKESGVGMNSICFLPSAFCVLLTADRQPHERVVRCGATLCTDSSLGQDVHRQEKRKQ